MNRQKKSYYYAALFALGIVLFGLAAIGAQRSQLQGWEERVFYGIFNWPDSLRLPFLMVTQLGSAATVAAAALIAYLSDYRQLAWRLLLTGSVAYLLVALAKDLINRPRPFLLLSNIHERELFVVSGKGFPSGHTAVATALALTLVPHLPKNWRWVALVWIVAVGLSRVYLGVHAPLDIVGGFGIGLAVAAALHFVLNTDKKLRKTR